MASRQQPIYPRARADMQNSEQVTAMSVAKATVQFARRHPKLMKKYVLPLALTSLSTPLFAALPLGALGPMLGYVAVASGRFKLRKELVGGYYALLHTAGMTGIKGQALSLLGLVGLEATGSHAIRDTFVKPLMEANVGIRAEVIGLGLAVLSGATGAFGALPSMLGTRAMSLLFNEFRAFVKLHGLKWAARNVQELWLTFVGSSEEIKAAFLAHVLRWKTGDKEAKIDDPEQKQWARDVQWAHDVLGKVAARLPQLPVEAILPQLAAVMEDKDKEQEPEEAIDEWVEIDGNYKELWVSVAYEENEGMESGTADLAAYADEAIFKDFSYHRSKAEIAQHLGQVTRQAFEGSRMTEEQMLGALDEIGLNSSTEAWREELKTEDDEEDGLEVIKYDDLCKNMDGGVWR